TAGPSSGHDSGGRPLPATAGGRPRGCGGPLPPASRARPAPRPHFSSRSALDSRRLITPPIRAGVRVPVCPEGSRMFTRTWCVAALLIVSVPAASQTVLSEADVLARLTADSPRARAILATADVARAEASGAGRYPNPRLSVDREAVAGVSERLITVLQPLPITGRRD